MLEAGMRLDIIGWFVARDRPALFPVTRRIDTPSLQPELERFSYNNRAGPVRRRSDIHERYQLRWKRNADLT